MNRRTRPARRDVDAGVISMVCALLLFAATHLGAAQNEGFRFPGRLESYLTEPSGCPPTSGNASSPVHR